MTGPLSQKNTEFDQYAASYSAALAQGISVSGEDMDFFARGRINWHGECLAKLQQSPQTILDFGCGAGSSASILLDLIKPQTVIGVDVSAGLLKTARGICPSKQVEFLLADQFQPAEQVDLAYCNGVFHHIAPVERASAINYVYRSLRPGGLFSLWENNPWNPGTRLVMARIPFDKNAVTLSSIDSRRMATEAGFEVLHTDFLFVFPRLLKYFRAAEPFLSRLPIGAQYQVLCRKPSNL